MIGQKESYVSSVNKNKTHLRFDLRIKKNNKNNTKHNQNDLLRSNFLSHQRNLKSSQI